jgi:hypothetical protein
VLRELQRVGLSRAAVIGEVLDATSTPVIDLQLSRPESS